MAPRLAVWQAHRVRKPKMTSEQLAEHLRLLQVAVRRDRDELLTDLLCHVYRTKSAQNG